MKYQYKYLTRVAASSLFLVLMMSYVLLLDFIINIGCKPEYILRTKAASSFLCQLTLSPFTGTDCSFLVLMMSYVVMLDFIKNISCTPEYILRTKGVLFLQIFYVFKDKSFFFTSLHISFDFTCIFYVYIVANYKNWWSNKYYRDVFAEKTKHPKKKTEV